MASLARAPRLLRAFAAVAATTALSLSLGILPAAADSTASVSMTEPSENNYAFAPSTVSVGSGTTITWTNKTDAPHTVTSDSGAFGSGTLTQNQTFAFTFKTAGTYAYHCAVHPYMKGTITVTAAQVSPAPAQQPSTRPAATSAPSAPQTQPQVPSQMPHTGNGGGRLGVAEGLLGAMGLALVIIGTLAQHRKVR